MQSLREIKTLVTSEGTNVTQTFIRVGPSFSATAVGNGDFQTFDEELAPRGEGWDYVESLNMPGNAERWASMAVEKLAAKSVEAGTYDLILEPTNLWLTIHESIGHPTELDRAIGEEANYAGTSFVAPPEKVIGQLKYGPPHHEHPGRPHAGRVAVASGLGRRRRAGRSVAARSRRASSRTTRPRASRRRGSRS